MTDPEQATLHDLGIAGGCVIDPDTVTGNATYTAPTRPSSGFAHVLVHGESVVAHGGLLVDARPGRGIRGLR